MTPITRNLLVWFFSFSAISSFGTGVRGTILTEDGSPLAYATIFVKQIGTGTTTNANGYYEITLSPGTYDMVFQYLGYETQVRKIEVGNAWIDINLTMKTQVTVLQTVTVKAGEEDPAYTIMRKAIAKANYHRQQLDSYSAKVYIKGAGKLKDYPWLAKRALEKEGVEKNRVYVMESVSEIEYTRPNTFKEKVISIHSDGKNNDMSPNPYIFGSFYESDVAGTVSPLSPKAFSYYRFEYMGTFKDRDYEVSRIKVIPRSKGDDVIDGVLYIVEDLWNIHSLDIHTTKLGIDINIKVIYAPIEDQAWLPVSHRFKMEGKVLGFEFEYNYLATVSDYKIKINPDLVVDKMEVIDETIQRTEAKEIAKKFDTKKVSKEDNTKQLQERLAAGEEITRKELKTIVKEYEKQEQRELKEPEVLSNVNYKIDSGAYTKDSVFWANIRPVPLTTEEVVGYHKADSMAEIDRKKEAGDTLKHKDFKPWDIILGNSYKLSKHSNLQIQTIMPNFNTVDGWNFNYRLTFGTIFQDTNKTRMTISPMVRYAVAREKFSGNLSFNLRNRNYRFKVEGGRYIRQFNADEPILPIVNSFTTLLLEQNFMKIYERDYIDVLYRRRINQFVTVSTTWSWMKRYPLQNNTDYKLNNRKNIEGYTSNVPVNEELSDTEFATHNAFIGTIGVSARPWLKFRIRNDHKYEIGNSSPTLTLDYRKGFSGILNSAVDFDQLELGIKHSVRLGFRGRLDFALKGGKFLNSDSLNFMDYKHFMGNRTPFATADPAASFRLLDYYKYSTSDQYFTANVNYQFRKFLITTIPVIRLAGIRENIFVSYLATPTSKNYTEVGYTIDGILRIFRLEAAASFINGHYYDYGFRIGIATNITVNFSDN